MGAWTVPYGIAIALLAAAGIAKVCEPRDTVGALARSGLVVPPVAVRGLAAFGDDYPQSVRLFLYRGTRRERRDDLWIVPIGEFLQQLRPDVAIWPRGAVRR